MKISLTLTLLCIQKLIYLTKTKNYLGQNDQRCSMPIVSYVSFLVDNSLTLFVLVYSKSEPILLSSFSRCDGLLTSTLVFFQNVHIAFFLYDSFHLDETLDPRTTAKTPVNDLEKLRIVVSEKKITRV